MSWVRKMVALGIGVSAVVLRIGQYLFSTETRERSRRLDQLLMATLEQVADQMQEVPSQSLLLAVAPISVSCLHSFNHTHTVTAVPIGRDVVSAMSTEPVLGFEARLNQIGFDLDQVPEQYFDPISFKIMENPVEAITVLQVDGKEKRTTHHYDDSTFEKLIDSREGTYLCPENRQPFIEYKKDESLKQEINDFVTACEVGNESEIASKNNL